MKPHLPPLGAALLSILCLSSGSGFAGIAKPNLFSFLSKSRQIHVRTTAYTHTESDHLQYTRQTAAGTRLKSGPVTSAAADWSFLPLGTTFRIKGDDTLYKIEDYGRALVGTETIDIYRPSTKAMNHWGVRHVEIEIVKVGCVEKSIDLLDDRTHHAHCRAMLAKLRKKS